jgi:acetyl/propionyl-CoA carboxylase alpha subunit/acetyl-CoA carboxylase carboxyltransferase component
MADRVLMIANRGEVALRVARSARELGYRTVAVHAADDTAVPNRLADEVAELAGSGPAAYLDTEAIVAAARGHGCSHVHPGWGFLSESAALAEACTEAGIVFVGPPTVVLRNLGDKVEARSLAAAADVPVLAGTPVADLATAAAFRASLGAGASVIIKAVGGGGGRGIRVVGPGGDLEAAYRRSHSEAGRGSADAAVYLEQYAGAVRHIEVQIAADADGSVVHLGERDCSLQRRRQKLVEVAPAPRLDPSVREEILQAAVRLARVCGYRNIGTFEFLLATDGSLGEMHFAFIEANPRLQVEHAVTEELFGVDLVALQLQLAEGGTLAELGMASPTPADGFVIEARINAETMTEDGNVVGSFGSVTALELPSGPGVRVDTAARVGSAVDPRFDSLLAKVVVRSRSDSYAQAVAKLARALDELNVEGVPTNIGVLRKLLSEPEVLGGATTTTYVDANAGRLASAATTAQAPALTPARGPSGGLDFTGADGLARVVSRLTGVVVAAEVAVGGEVGADAAVVIVEAMKMEHVVVAGTAGIVRDLLVSPGDAVEVGQVVALLQPADVAEASAAVPAAVDLEEIRPDLAELFERRRLLGDETREAATNRRHSAGKRTARGLVDDLCDEGSFEEYGGFAVAAQSARRSAQDLMTNTPADGLVAGIGRVNGDMFDDERARCAVLSYDYTVLAGTQGQRNHQKKDRLLELVERLRLPVVLFAEGGGGRPGDSDFPVISGLDTRAFAMYGALSGLVPLVGIAQGRCFAGNAALLGCSDVVIATTDANIGMGGPAMIEGGGLGTFSPDDIGPIDVQAPNGVVDVVVADDREAVAVAKRYLSYFQGPLASWTCADQRALRHVVPANRSRVYDVRRVIEVMADTSSVLELRQQFGIGIVTALARIEGRPVGVICNNPAHLGGAIDAPASDKAARFMQLCDAFDLPILFLCDTPGFMVGPEAERSAQVRHFSRMFVNGASLTVPFFTIVLRKGYGLGAQAMAGGSFRSPLFTVSWPSGEFGGMGLEGAVRLSMRRELEAVADDAEREELYRSLVARAYERGKALSMATNLEIDDVIDPAESRRRIAHTLEATGPRTRPHGKKRPCIDAW